MYIQALLYDYQLGAAEESDPSVRQRYQQEAARIGKEALWQKLQVLDPLAAAKIHYNNERKVIRALEVLETTGISIAAPTTAPEAVYDYFMIGFPQTDSCCISVLISESIKWWKQVWLRKHNRC